MQITNSKIFKPFLYIILLLLWSSIFQIAVLHSQNWMQIQDIPSEYVNDVIEYDGYLYAVTDSTVYKSIHDGDSWQLTVQQPASKSLHTIFGNAGYLYIGTRGDGVFRSQDGGISWQALNTGLTGNARSVYDFAMRGDSLYAGTDGGGIYVLNLQNPVQWTSYNTGLTQFSTSSIAVSGNVLIAAIGSFVYMRPAGAGSWILLSIDPESIPIPYKIFPTDTYIFVGTADGIYRGNVDGTDWQKRDIVQFSGRDITTFAVHGNRIFAGLLYLNSHYMFSSDDYGETWYIRAHEFSFLFDMMVSENRLWAARDDGLWYYDIGWWTGIDNPGIAVPSVYLLDQNYPNPFNPVTTIGYSVPEFSHVNLTVYDLLGEPVTTLVDDDKLPGNYSISFNASSLSSGVYYYRLKAGNYTNTKKFTLVR
jgi:hypothetical protein